MAPITSSVAKTAQLAAQAMKYNVKPSMKTIGQYQALRMMDMTNLRSNSTKSGPQEMTVRDALNSGLAEELDRDDDVFNG